MSEYERIYVLGNITKW